MGARRDMLLDTGPLVALIDAGDQWHEPCVEAWHEVAERCVTTEAVMTEASHLVARGGGDAQLPLDLILGTHVPIMALERAGYEHALRLMRRYADLPMDFADATLVVVGEALRSECAFTLDRRGFRTYRRASGTSFQLVP